MSIKKAYYYLFYKLYKHFENSSQPWWSDSKASFSIIVLQIWLLASILIYYKLYVNLNADIIGAEMQWIIIVLILVLIDYLIFHHNNQWKNIILEFDKFPKKRNIVGGWVVFGVIVLIIANLIFSFYLFYQTE